MSEATDIKSHPHDRLNMNWNDNRHARVDMAKAHKASTAHKELQATRECWEQQNTPIGYAFMYVSVCVKQ